MKTFFLSVSPTKIRPKLHRSRRALGSLPTLSFHVECTCSLCTHAGFPQLRLRQPDLHFLHQHFSSGFAPILQVPSIHLWAQTHDKSLQTHLKNDKVILLSD